MRNRKTIYIVLTLIFSVGFYLYDNFSTEDFIETTKEKTSNIKLDLSPTSTTGQIIEHAFYKLSYSEKDEQAEWVAYQLKDEDISSSNFKRPYFIKDPKVLTKSAHYKNYSKSGFDKGHLCPAGDRKFSKLAYNETFLTSNISPQEHKFNAGIWNRLEQKTRYWAKKYKSVYVVTGGVLKNTSKTIGSEKITVPNYFYKIILDYQEPEIKAIAFLIPHKESKSALYKFVTSIDEIEKITGIDFFPKLEDSLENKLEKSSNYSNWIFR
ncbi:DNA/RNA non-specific endonuclease [Lutibacter citreus]|uniref:DNA/RNA non-specific endonuclease n=1 Tax=Lutibacter citreus TaxID=2138210 RepID=UPI000DBE09AE|nr:DNA/RNA non-specific endonuclease [Lutibacter citreus]